MKSGKLAPPPPGFASTSFQLYDENGAVVTVNPHDFLDTCRLGYTYTPPALPLPFVKAIEEPLRLGPGDSPKLLAGIVESVGSLDPAPVDAILNLDGVKVDLNRLASVMLMVDNHRIPAGRIATFGHVHNLTSFPCRIGLRTADLQLLREATTVQIGLVSINYFRHKWLPDTFTPVRASLTFYQPAE